MTIVVLPQAADEFDDAVAYYEAKQPGLGHRFRDEVHRHIQWITANPTIPRLRAGGYRRVNLKAFKHYVAYVQIGTTLWILSIAHGRRKPEYWIQRKQNLSQPGGAANGSQPSQSG